MAAPQISIVILSHNHPETTTVRCVRSLAKTVGVTYEVIVVDNASDAETVEQLQRLKQEGLIDKLLLEPVNHYFLGNNLGVAASHPESPYLLLLNSDTEVLTDCFLAKIVEWMEGLPEHRPAAHGPLKPPRPKVPSPGPRDVISVGWCSDPTVPGAARFEGFCILIRRKLWEDIDPAYPWHYGLDEMLCRQAKRHGARIGLLHAYDSPWGSTPRHLKHYQHGSGTPVELEVRPTKPVDLPAWYSGVDIETLDWEMGPYEWASFLEW